MKCAAGSDRQIRYWGLCGVMLGVLVLGHYTSTSTRVQFNLDALCIARRVSAYLPGDICRMDLQNYLRDGGQVLPAVRLASLLALLEPIEDGFAQQVLRVELTPQQLDVVTRSRMLLLRHLHDQQPQDLIVWREAAASRIFADIAIRMEVIGATDAAVGASELAYMLDFAWRDPWQRGLNARSVGRKYMENGQLAQAAAAYTRSIESFAQTDEPAALEYTCYSYYRLGMIAEQEQEFADAIVYYGQAILTSPQHADFLRPANLLLAQGRNLDDVYAFLADLRQKGRQNDSYLWGNSASVFLELGAFHMAERVLAETPIGLKEAPGIRFAYARLAAAQSQWSQAEALYTSLLAEEKSSANHEWIQSLTSALGETIFQQGRCTEASELLKEATPHLAPRSPSYWYNLGQACHGQGEDEKARWAYRRALEIAPDYQAASQALAELEE